MSLEAFHNLDFEQYRASLTANVNACASLLLMTEDEVEQQGVELGASQLAELRQLLLDNPQVEVGGVQFLSQSDGNMLYVRNLQTPMSPQYLVLFLQQSSTDRQLHDVLKASGGVLFGTLDELLNLHTELNEMADDLAFRYEELNLFYGLDDVVESKDGVHGARALSRLAENCSQFLDTDVIGISILPVSIAVESDSTSNPEFQQHWSQLKDDLLPRFVSALQGRHRPLIINQQDQINKLFTSRLPAKLALAPIHGTREELLGVVYFLKQHEASDFMTSDRRLLRVLAEQASAIISSSFDLLTGFLNRDAITVQISTSIANIDESKDMHVLLWFDINQFKLINDTAGRVAGDELLKQVGRALRSTFADNASYARVGSDEFCVLINGISADAVGQRAQAMLDRFISTGFRWKEVPYQLSAAVGVAALESASEDASDAMERAQIACSIASESGRGCVFVYDPSSPKIQSARSVIDWTQRIGEALKNDYFDLHVQKIVPLQQKNHTKHHYEVLLRLQEPGGDPNASPFQMIKAAESYNLISNIDRWVISTALQRLKHYLELYPQLDLSFSINLSGQSVNEEFFSFLKNSLMEQSALIPRLSLEITETAVVSNLNEAIRLMDSLKSIGVRFSLDDFGTGMSSFAYLRNLPVDFLKIDGAFVKNITEDRINYGMVEAIQRIGHIMGLKTVAEFVENQVIVDLLKKIGVDYGQGYGLHKPEAMEAQIQTLLTQSMHPELIVPPKSATG